MPLHFSLLLSLVLHALVLLPLLDHAITRPPLPPAAIDARLLPEPPPEAVADNLSSVPEPSATPPPPQALPRQVRGEALRRTQSALSHHLFYPPEAIKRGLEGEVILLLMLDASGRVQSAEIARSSGHALLDDAALDAARRIGALPGNPRQTLFPVSFRLE